MSIIHSYSKGIIIQHSIRNNTNVTPGTPSPNITRRLDRFDISSQTWSKKKDMNQARAGFALYNFGDELIAIGGTDGSVFHKTIEVYNILENEWSFKKSMSRSKCFFQSCIVYDDIYVIGGLIIDSSGNITVSSSVEKYNITTDTWVNLASLPKGITFGVAHQINNKIYVLNGFSEQLESINKQIFIYDIALNTWTTIDLSEEDLKLYTRILPFSFIKDDYIFVTNGLFYETNQLVQPPTISTYFASDTFKINTLNNELTRSDSYFSDIPSNKYNGNTIELNDLVYLIGGISNNSNTTKDIYQINTNESPFGFSNYDKLPKGRSSFGSALSDFEYDTAIYVSGGISSKQQENFIYVMLDSLSKNVKLNGKETAAIDIKCVDENNDSPESIKVQLIGTANNSNMVLFTSDYITVENGYATATLLPRSEEIISSINVKDKDFINSYTVNVKGVILDDTYYGESDSVIINDNNGNGGQNNGNGGGTFNPRLPNGVDLLDSYQSVINIDQQSQNAFISGGNIGGVINLYAYNTIGSNKDTTLNYINTQSWLPYINAKLNLNNSSYEDVINHLNRMEKEVPFGGTPLLDALDESFDLFELDLNDLNKVVYINTDGEENCSNLTTENIIERDNAITGQNPFPLVFSSFRVVPSHLHLNNGIRDGSPILEELSEKTNGSVTYFITDAETETYINELIRSQGFLGDGTFTCVIDLAEDVRINNIKLNFDNISDDNGASWYYTVINNEYESYPQSELNEPNTEVTLNKTNGRFINLKIDFFLNLNSDTYNATKVEPPKLTSIDITYNEKTISYIFMNGIDTVDEIYNVAISLDAVQPIGSELNVASTSQNTKNWNDFVSISKPSLDNNSKIIFPIRKKLDPREYLSLEPLISIDGFIFESKYGKWDNNATVRIYTEDGTLVDPITYKTFPNRGQVVFNNKKIVNYLIEIQNQPHLEIGAEIINRVNGEPVIITGAGFMYSTLKSNLFQHGSSILPEAINLLVLPINPSVNSVFTSNWTFYDLKGRSDKNSQIKWYINSIEQEDLQNLNQWDNKIWKLAKSGDSIYFTILPKASDDTLGRLTKSNPIKIL